MPKKIIIIGLASIIMSLVFALVSVNFKEALAATSGGGWNPKGLEVTKLPSRPVADILITLIDWAIMIIGLLGVIVFIYGGYVYLTCQGENDKVEQAKKIITYGIIGIAVSVLGYVAVLTIDKILKGNINSGGSSSGGSSGTITTQKPPINSGTGSSSQGPYAMPVSPDMLQP